jgi:malonate decarboxylase epsilon subunit
MLSNLPDLPAVIATLGEADQLLPMPVAELDDPGEQADTVSAQLGLLVCAVAATRALDDLGARPAILAGHSVGAFAAAVAAGALEFAEAIDAVTHRASRMAELFPRGYGMVAISGLREAEVRRLTERATKDGMPVWLANVNSADQMVVAGDDAALNCAVELARTAGARRAQRLAVAVPSHAPILAPVTAELRSTLKKVPHRALRATYVMISRARPARTSMDVIEDLAVSVSHILRWRDVFGVITELGAPFILQLPPGRTLVGLAQSELSANGIAGVDVRAMSETRLDDSVYLTRRAAADSRRHGVIPMGDRA